MAVIYPVMSCNHYQTVKCHGMKTFIITKKMFREKNNAINQLIKHKTKIRIMLEILSIKHVHVAIVITEEKLFRNSFIYKKYKNKSQYLCQYHACNTFIFFVTFIIYASIIISNLIYQIKIRKSFLII